jgi:hypothetical protein
MLGVRQHISEKPCRSRTPGYRQPMVENVIKVFLGLVALLYVVHNPDGVVNVLQTFADAAFKFMKALTGLDLHI